MSNESLVDTCAISIIVDIKCGLTKAMFTSGMRNCRTRRVIWRRVQKTRIMGVRKFTENITHSGMGWVWSHQNLRGRNVTDFKKIFNRIYC